jgi:hypothetical protein
MTRAYSCGNLRPLPDCETLGKLFSLDPITGSIQGLTPSTDKTIKSLLKRKSADTRIRLFGARYRIERIAWKMYHGLDPDSIVTALDGNPLNLRRDNLVCDLPNRSSHPLFTTWIDMIYRCYAPSHVSYADYGARGIRVCDRWLHSFESFVTDVGARPEGTTLHRVDNNSGYSPDNCVWADHSTQHARGAKRWRRLTPSTDPMRNIEIENRASPYRLKMKLPNSTWFNKSFKTTEEAMNLREIIDYERELYKALLHPECCHFVLRSKSQTIND